MAAVISEVDRLISSVGFRRQDRTWNRTAYPFVDVIDLQVSKAGDRLTINAGVLYPRAYQRCWARDPTRFVDEPSCTVRARIGQLIGGQDLWWPSDDNSATADIISKLRLYILPFIEDMHSQEAMVNFLENSRVTEQSYPPPIIYLAALKFEQGDRSAACALLDDLQPRMVGAWKSRVDQIRHELGCSRD
jgi:hypothetical protein